MNAESTSRPSSFKDEQRRIASLALDLTEQEWEVLGLPDDTSSNDIRASSSLDVSTERVTSLLLIRLIALENPSHKFTDLSTTSICRRIVSSQYLTSVWPEAVTEKVVIELRQFVRAMLDGYNDVPYHNRNHAYHVVISSNKLMNLVLQSRSTSTEKIQRSPNELCFEEDPLMHLALIFAALVHDVDHLGVPNAQLINENHPLALQYNDQSIAEQRSLYLAFCELLKPEYESLRTIMFPFTFAGDGYRRFRSAVTNLVLATDIASSERSEIVKKKWSEAFEGVSMSRILPQSGKKKRMPKGRSASIIAPPKEHPTPSQSRRKLKNMNNEEQTGSLAKELSQTDTEWVELGATPSTHFPTGTAHSIERKTQHSMQDSLMFWWFAPEEESWEELDSTDSDDSFFSNDNSCTDFFSASEGEITSQGYQASKSDLDSSISIADTLNSDFFDSYSYPHQSQAFQFSCSSMENSADLQHLLTPSKRSARSGRPNRSASLSWGKRNNNDSAGYSDLSIQSGSDPFLKVPPRRAMSSFCTPTRKGRKKNVLEMSEVDIADLTCTDVSSHTFNTRLEANKAVTEQKEQKSRPDKSKQTQSEQLRSLSLMEHILLVSDVAHTMQCWEVMNKFAYRLSQEIQASIDHNRSGSITSDPLNDWYSNQSGFLLGYIKPLAERLEKTGYIPVLKPSLTVLVKKNLDRWQEEGHDVVASWRRKRERQKGKEASKSPRLDEKRKEKKHSSKPSKSSSKLDAPESDSSKKKAKKKKKKKDTKIHIDTAQEKESSPRSSRNKKTASLSLPERKSSKAVRKGKSNEKSAEVLETES